MNALLLLAQISVSSVVIYLAILLFRKLFAGRISAALQYGIWFVLVMRLLLPVTIDSGFSVFTLPQPAAQVFQVTEPSVESDIDINPAAQGGLAANQKSEVTAGEAVQKRAPEQQSGPARGTTAERPQPWDARLLLLAVWGGGAVAMFAWFLAAFLRLSGNIKKNSRPLSSADRLVFDAVKDRLSVKGRIEPLLADTVATPAITMSLFPRLLLPNTGSGMPPLGSQELENIFRHELTHFKRGDHLVCLLLMALRCVYWFNPVVWLAAKQMQLDMEIACDNIAARDMDGDGKKRYASTILDMIGRCGKPRLVMGMGTEYSRANVEKRLRGVFMKAKSGATVRLAAAATAALLFAACFTTACTPTAAPAALLSGPSAAAPSASPTATASAAPSATVAPESTKLPETAAAPTAEPTPSPAPKPELSLDDLHKLQIKYQKIAGNIAVGEFTFAIRKDGKIMQAGKGSDIGVFDTKKWSHIVAVSAGYFHLVGLKSDGTVVVAGSGRAYMSNYVKGWKNIVSVAAGGNEVILGLKRDGTVVSSGIPYDSSDPNKVKNWRKIVAIGAGDNFGVGLRADGTVVATGQNDCGQCNVGDWKDIVQISVGINSVIGLKSDGTVVYTGAGIENIDVSSWRDIVSVSTGCCPIGIKADGTVIQSGMPWDLSGWTDIVALTQGMEDAVALRADGTVLAIGNNRYGECNVQDWTGIATQPLK